MKNSGSINGLLNNFEFNSHFETEEYVEKIFPIKKVLQHLFAFELLYLCNQLFFPITNVFLFNDVYFFTNIF